MSIIQNSGTFTLTSAGRPALTVHRLGFGAMQLLGPGAWGPPADPANALAVLRASITHGVDLIDTSDAYGPTINEETIRQALHPYPKGLLIATKAGLARTGPDRWIPLGRPEYLRQCCELSLRRLGLETIGLYQLHRIDPKVPADEQFGVLRELQQEGKIQHVGLSEVSIEEIRACQRIVPVASVQNLYNLADQRATAVLDYCTAQGIGFIPWFPLADGRLSRPGGALDLLARATGHTPSQLALAWLLARSPAMLPIPGTSSLAHLAENCAGAGIRLTAEQIAKLSAAAQASSAKA